MKGASTNLMLRASDSAQLPPGTSRWVCMAPPLFLRDPLDDDPTDRFAIQACPHCAVLTAVALCQETTTCEACGERIEIAPLVAAVTDGALR